MTQMMIKANLSGGGGVCPPMPETIVVSPYIIEGYGLNVSQADVSAGFELVDGGIWWSFYISPTTTYPTQSAVTPFPVPAADLWFRWSDNYTPRSKASTPGANDGWTISIDGIATTTDFDDEFQVTTGTEFRLLMPAGFGSEFPRKDQTFDVFLEICLDCNGAPDGIWYSQNIKSHNSTSGAIQDFDWWGGVLQVYDAGADPNPKMEFLQTQGSGSGPNLTGHCNVEYTTAAGLAYMSYWNSSAGPLPLGQYVVNWSSFSGTGDGVIAKDRTGTVMVEESDYELIECTFELDFSADPPGTFKDAVFWVFVMDSTDAWREVQRRVYISGQKASSDDLVFVFTTTAASTSIILPTAQYKEGTTTPMVYNCSVDWGDGSGADVITSWNQAERTHVYAVADTYTVTITGVFERIDFTATGVTPTTRSSLAELRNWGNSVFKDFHSCLEGCFNAVMTAVDPPNLSAVTSLQNAFWNCFSMVGDWSRWDVSTITNMKQTFYRCTLTGADFTNWDVSSVTDMTGMFQDAGAPVGLAGWDVSNVTSMQVMFDGSLFNEAIPLWNVSSVLDFSYMFSDCSFNQNIDGWTINPVGPVNMASMFYLNLGFNQPLNSWDMSAVTNITSMFQATEAFNQPLTSWDITGCTSLNSVFWYAIAFDGDVSGWNTSNITDMYGTFRATAYTKDLSAWDYTGVSGGTAMRYFMSNVTWSTAMWDLLIGRLYDQRASLNTYVTLNVDASHTISTSGAKLTALATDPPAWNITDGGGV